MRLYHTRDHIKRDLLVNNTTFNANPSANTQAVAVEHNTPATTKVINRHDLDHSKPAPVRPEPANKKVNKRQNIVYNNRGLVLQILSTGTCMG
jgi:hypothetical protein